MTWPPELLDVFHSSVTAEFAGLTRAGLPITVPTTPYVGDGTLDLSTGLTYPAKAERVRRNPKACLLFADPIGSGSPADNHTVVAVQGLAAVRDADLQANADRYVRLSMAKLPDATKGQPRIILRRMAWYYARIWVEITPVRILWWPGRDLTTAPHVWTADNGAGAGTAGTGDSTSDRTGTAGAPVSDPAPTGSQPPPWLPPPTSWQEARRYALAALPQCDLTVVDANGFPLCVPVNVAASHAEGFSLELGPGVPWAGDGAAEVGGSAHGASGADPAGGGVPVDGPACLTFHTHDERFTGQENRTFVGRFRPVDGVFEVDRALADWSLAGGRTRVAAAFLGSGRRLRPRLRAEAARRGQPVPTVRFPGEY